MSSFYIPKPCHENWNSMTPAEQGRHCAVCNKVVIDFTTLKKNEVTEILDNSHGQVCGQFRMSQLNVSAQKKVFLRPRNLFNRNFRYFTMTLLGLFMFTKKSEAHKTRGAFLKGGPRPVQDQNQTGTVNLTGQVQTKDMKPAGGASLVFSYKNKILGRTKTTDNGNFSFSFENKGPAGMNVNILVQYPGYHMKVITDLTLDKKTQNVNIILENEILFLGQAMRVADTANTAATDDDTVKVTVCEPAVVVPDTIRIIENTAAEQSVAEQPNNKENTGEERATGSQAPLVIRPEDIRIIVYPNPASAIAAIYCNHTADYNLELYDVKGTLFMSRSFSGNRFNVDISHFSPGTYFIRVKDSKGFVNTVKLVKQ